MVSKHVLGSALGCSIVVGACLSLPETFPCASDGTCDSPGADGGYVCVSGICMPGQPGTRHWEPPESGPPPSDGRPPPPPDTGPPCSSTTLSFSSDPVNGSFSVLIGDWAWNSGTDQLDVAAPSPNALAWIGPRDWTSYTISVPITLVSGTTSTANAGINFRIEDPGPSNPPNDAGHMYYAGFGTNAVVLGLESYGWTQLQFVPGNFALGTPHTLTVSAIGSTLTVQVDGTTYITQTDSTLAYGSFGFRAFEMAAAYGAPGVVCAGAPTDGGRDAPPDAPADVVGVSCDASAASCSACCEASNPAGVSGYTTVQSCVCQPSRCAALCGSTFCANGAVPPAPDPCKNCIDEWILAGQPCNPVAVACAMSPSCLALSMCEQSCR